MMISQRTRWRRVTTSPSSNSLTVAAVLLAALLPEALPLQAQEAQQQQTPPTQEGRQTHIVRPGDTLWDLAQFYLTDPFLWPEIYRINTMVVEDPHWIYPDERLRLPGAEEIAEVELIAGEIPVEGLPGEGEVEVAVEPEVMPPEAEFGEIEPIDMSGVQTIFVARQLQRQTLTYQREPPTPPVAVSEYDFHRAAMLVQLDELGARGEVIEPAAARATVNVRGDYLNVTVFSKLYVSHPGGEPPSPGDLLLLLQIDRRVKGYGYVIRPTGLVTVAAVYDDVSTVVVTEIYDPINIGNSAVRAERFDDRPGVFAQPVATGPSGELVGVFMGQAVPSVEDIIFIDIGRNQGVDIGDEFSLYAPNRVSTSGYRLPEEPIAVGRVVRVMEGTSTLRVISQEHPAIIEGLPVRMVAKMPS